jgi:hypothetical protein
LLLGAVIGFAFSGKCAHWGILDDLVAARIITQMILAGHSASAEQSTALIRALGPRSWPFIANIIIITSSNTHEYCITAKYLEDK